MSKFFYCQRDIEGDSKCEEQCEHCKEYYAPLEKIINSQEDIDPEIQDIVNKNFFKLI